MMKRISIIMLSLLFILPIFTGLVGAEEVKDEACHMDRLNLELNTIRPHFDFYYELLAEKYAPKHVKVWQEVLKEREDLFAQYLKLKKAGKDVDNFYNEDWLKKHNELHQQFLEAVNKRDDAALKKIIPPIIDHQKALNKLIKAKIKQ